MKTPHIFFVCLLISIGANIYQYFNEQQLRVNAQYFEARYEVKDEDVRTLLDIAASHLSGLSLADLTSHLEARGIKYRKDSYPQTPEFIYVLVGELTFRFTNKGVFVGVVQSSYNYSCLYAPRRRPAFCCVVPPTQNSAAALGVMHIIGQIKG